MRGDVERGRARRGHLIVPVDFKGIADLEAERRLKLFWTTGNKDYLIDVARLAMWAWMNHGGEA